MRALVGFCPGWAQSPLPTGPQRQISATNYGSGRAAAGEGSGLRDSVPLLCLCLCVSHLPLPAQLSSAPSTKPNRNPPRQQSRQTGSSHLPWLEHRSAKARKARTAGEEFPLLGSSLALACCSLCLPAWLLLHHITQRVSSARCSPRSPASRQFCI